MSEISKQIKSIVKIGKRLQKKGFVAGIEGNISIKALDGTILITPSGKPKGNITENDIVILNPDGSYSKGIHKPSSELPMHLIVFQNRSDILACVHSHAPYSTAFALAGLELPDTILPEIFILTGKIPITDFAIPGTDELAESLLPFLKESNAFLLKNHGLLTIGRTISEAYNLHETVEHFAKIYFLARQLGEISPLSDKVLNQLTQLNNDSKSELKIKKVENAG